METGQSELTELKLLDASGVGKQQRNIVKISLLSLQLGALRLGLRN